MHGTTVKTNNVC